VAVARDQNVVRADVAVDDAQRSALGVGAAVGVAQRVGETRRQVEGDLHGQLARLLAGRVDHTLYDQLLQQYVDEKGLVDYSGWKNKGMEKIKSPITLATRKETGKIRRCCTAWPNCGRLRRIMTP